MKLRNVFIAAALTASSGTALAQDDGWQRYVIPVTGGPPGIMYRRVTPGFFAVSSERNGKIWYNRCNASGRFMNCVLINYPAAEKRRWDSVVTRISRTLVKG